MLDPLKNIIEHSGGEFICCCCLEPYKTKAKALVCAADCFSVEARTHYMGHIRATNEAHAANERYIRANHKAICALKVLVGGE